MEQTSTALAPSGIVSDRRFALAVTAAYVVLTGFVSAHHEVWRDEVVPLSLAAQSGSLAEVAQNNRNFGHPGLWYFLLHAGYQVFPNAVVLKILNLLACAAAAFLFLEKAPFRRATRTLFVAGFFPLYLYPVFNRNYGLMMLLAFVVCALYKERWRRFIPFAVALALLANVHAHALVLVLAALVSLAAEAILPGARAELRAAPKAALAAGLAILALGIAGSVAQILPDSRSVIFEGDRLDLPNFARATLHGLVNPGKIFSEAFGLKSALFTNVVVFSLYLHLLRKPNVLILFLSGVLGLFVFSDLFYPSPRMRHQGALFLLVAMAHWLAPRPDAGAPRVAGALAFVTSLPRLGKTAVWVLALVLQVRMAYPEIRDEIRLPYSASKGLADFIRSSPPLKDAVLLGAPEGPLESLPYYLDNPIYFLSEGKFARYRRLTNEGPMTASLRQLLRKAQELKRKGGRPVLALLDPEIRRKGPYTVGSMHHKKTFTFSREEFDEFQAAASLLVSFPDSISGEAYRVYEVK